MDKSLEQKRIMGTDFSGKNLQRASFRNEYLAHVKFLDTDLRGADFTGAILTGAVFDHVKTGITPFNKVLIFFAALVISLLSGYIASLAAHTIQSMFASNDPNVRNAGIFSVAIIIAFILYSVWKGVENAIIRLLLPASALALLVGTIAGFSGIGTGEGALSIILYFLLVVVMFVIGTIARAAAGSLSNILFLIVALSGGVFGRNLGGGIGSVIMALACAQISKRALKGAPGFELLRRIASWITARFGTSFRNANLSDVTFAHSDLHNTDFSNANVSMIKWRDCKRVNCADPPGVSM